MKKVLIALKLADQLPAEKADLIGCDKGALTLAQQHRHMVCAVGDFDSVREDDISLIAQWCDQIIRLNPIKDDSDSEHAVKTAIDLGYDHIVMCGAFGGRADHALVNLRLLWKYKDCLELWDAENDAYVIGPGRYEIRKNGYDYISFFTWEDAAVTLSGFKYPLTDRTLTPSDLYTVSNEILKDEGIVEVKRGHVMVLQCKD